MPRKRLTMRKIREVLRLKAAGLNIREVAEGTGSARTTVYEYLVRAEGAGLSWPLPEGMDDEALEARLFPRLRPSCPGAGRCPIGGRSAGNLGRQARDAAAVVAGVETRPSRRLGLQPVLLALRPMARPPGRGHAAQLPGRREDVRRLQWGQGALLRPQTGEVAQAEVFVAVLGCSGMLYVEATPGQGLRSWLMAHVHAFEAFGGAPVATTLNYVARNIIEHNSRRAPRKVSERSHVAVGPGRLVHP